MKAFICINVNETKGFSMYAIDEITNIENTVYFNIVSLESCFYKIYGDSALR
jgi:hypothetical protein